MCIAMAPLMKDGPVHYCLSPAIHPKPGGYTFSASSSSIDQIAAVTRYYRMKGLDQARGVRDDRRQRPGRRPCNRCGPRLSREQGRDAESRQEHFNPKDIYGLRADRAHQGLRCAGDDRMDDRRPRRHRAQRHGASRPRHPGGADQRQPDLRAMDQWKTFCRSTSSSPPRSIPSMTASAARSSHGEGAARHVCDPEASTNLKADNQVATSWDTGLIIVAGLRKLGPDASAGQLKDFIANLTDFPGVDGIYDFKQYPERGLGPDASTVTTYDPKTACLGMAIETGRRAAELTVGEAARGDRPPACCARPHPSRCTADRAAIRRFTRYGAGGSPGTIPRSPRASPTKRRRTSWRNRGIRGSHAL